MHITISSNFKFRILLILSNACSTVTISKAVIQNMMSIICHWNAMKVKLFDFKKNILLHWEHLT